MRRMLTGGLLLLALVSFGSRGDELSVIIIANRTVQQSSLPLETVRAIFAMRQRTLPGGQAVHVFVLPDDNPVHEEFSKKILGVYPHQLRLAWDRAVFSGTGQAPNEVENEADMLEAVASTPGSIGYIKQSNLNDQVRVLDIE
jgi:ABC-type phosphate transport system substrate-binding protein